MNVFLIIGMQNHTTLTFTRAPEKKYMNIRNGQFYINSDCQMKPNDIDPVLNLIQDQQVILVEKCPQQQTVVYTGITVDRNQETKVLPDRYVYLENDKNTETLFQIQNNHLPHIPTAFMGTAAFLNN